MRGFAVATLAILLAQPATALPVAPAYRVVEGLSDGAFDFMRGHIIGLLLPEKLARSLKAASSRDSTALFERNLQKNEARYLDRVRAACRTWTAQEQLSVVADSFKDTLVERYQLELFGESSGRYVADRRNWDPGFLTTAGLLGGAFLYVNGMHASFRAGDVEISMDLAPGLKLRQAFQGDGNARNLIGFELGRRNAPITLAAQWGLDLGRLNNERVGLNYRLRY